MKTIYKYKISNAPWFDLLLPKESEILHIGNQGNESFMWIMHDLAKDKEVKSFKLFPTGVEFNSSELSYVGTLQISEFEYNFVYHLFEIIK